MASAMLCAITNVKNYVFCLEEMKMSTLFFASEQYSISKILVHLLLPADSSADGCQLFQWQLSFCSSWC